MIMPVEFVKTGSKVELEIARLREINKPEPVKLHHIPKWFKQKLILWLKLHDRYDQWASVNPLNAFAKAINWHVDHSGSSDNGWKFVNEPYGERDDKNAEVAKALGCDFCMSSNSYWYPGRTTRYEFTRKASTGWVKS